MYKIIIIIIIIIILYIIARPILLIQIRKCGESIAWIRNKNAEKYLQKETFIDHDYHRLNEN